MGLNPPAGGVGSLVSAGVDALAGAVTGHTSDAHGFRFEAGPYRGGQFQVISFRGEEALSRLYSIEVLVAAHDVDPRTLEGLLLGQPAALDYSLEDGPRRVIHGVLASVQFEPALAETEPFRVRARLVPRAWLLRRNRASRIFQDLSVTEIVSALLREAGVAHEWKLAGRYAKRVYCVQYRESDWSFITRLLAEEGVFFYFTQPAGLLSEVASAASAVVGTAANLARGALATVGADGLSSAVGRVGAAVTGALEASEGIVFADRPEFYPPIASEGAAEVLTGLASTALNAVGSLGRAGAAVAQVGAAALNALAAPTLQYRNAQDMLPAEDQVSAFTLRRTVRSNSTLLRDYDFRRPSLNLTSAASNEPLRGAANAAGDVMSLVSSAAGAAGALMSAVGIGAGTVRAGAIPPLLLDPKRSQVYDHHGEDEHPDVTRSEAQVRLEQYRSRVYQARGESYCRRLSPGHRFHLVDHPIDALDRDYVVTRVRHEGRASEMLAADQGAATDAMKKAYEAAFEAAPANLPVRPRRPQRRFHQILESARVVGPIGEEVYTDNFGRVKVQFHWDLDGKNDGYSSCWIRVSQAWAGAGFGAQFVPRVGMEVLVSFLGGDQDRPVVTGCLYNGEAPPPFDVPEDKTRSGFRTRTSPGGDGHNELSFEDSPGGERVDIRAERTLATQVVRASELRVGLKTSRNEAGEGYLTEAIATDHTETVGRDHVARVGRDQREEVGGNHVHAVRGASATQVDGDASRRVRGALREAVGGSRYVEVRQSDVRAVVGDVSSSVRGDERAFVQGTRRVTLGGDDELVVMRAASVSTGGDFLVSAGRAMRLEALDSVRISCGASSIELTPTGVVITGPSITALASSDVSLQAPDASFALRAGVLDVEAKTSVELTADDHVALTSKDASAAVSGADGEVALGAKCVRATAKSASLELASNATLIGSKVALNPTSASTTSSARDATPDALKTSWVDLRLVDDAGAPVPGARFVVKMSNGEEVGGVLNAAGYARVRTLPGASKVTFPDYDAAAWK